jgi:copper resistance protein C
MARRQGATPTELNLSKIELRLDLRSSSGESRMNALNTLLAIAAIAASGVASSHSSVYKSVPVNNSTVTVAPQDLSLTFTSAVRLTVLTLQRGDGKPQNLGPLPKLATKSLTVAMPVVAAGSYIVKWRAAGNDGHVMSGKIFFKIAPLAIAK